MRLSKKLFNNFPSESELMNMIMHTSSTVWENQLFKADIEKWLTNFKGELFPLSYERLIALWLLSHFTFYNQAEVTHLCKVIYRELIHLIIDGTTINKNTNLADVVNDFFEKTNIIPSEQTSGSGGFIAYFFRQINELPFDLFNYSITNISKEKENIVIIDDVTLTAGKDGQMGRFLSKNLKTHTSKKFYLLTLIASESAINYLTTTFNIKVVSAIKLDSRDKCFSSESDVFSSFPELIDIGRSFAEHYGKKIGLQDPLGYKDGQYTFGFFYNTPDNTLPIFWARVNGWIPIINRYHKNYGLRKFLKDERFI